MRFEFATATRILFGPGTVDETAAAAAGFGRRALVVSGKSARHAIPLLEQLKAAGLTAGLFQVDGEPTVEMVVAGLSQARTEDSQLVIAIGGGSALDAGKAIAALLANPGDIYDYLEVVGKGQPLAAPSLPFIAIPTTSGTGSEVTRNSVLTDTKQRTKISMRSPWMLPRLAIVDPQLTHGLPPAVTAASGMDALTQLIEPFVSSAANPLSDALSRDGLARVAHALRPAYTDDSPQAREDMALASLFGGLALANAKLGAVHAFAGPLGGMYPAPHGALCARLLPVIMDTNLKALRQREPHSPLIARFNEIAAILTGNPAANAEDGLAWVEALCVDFKIPRLAGYGVKEADFASIAGQAKTANSMKGNPLALNDDELNSILERSF